MYIFITNPNARSGLGHKIWDQLERILKNRSIPYEVHFTKYQRHATLLVRDITSDRKEHTLVVLGGDGTINEVVNGITDFSKITLGYIPIGSSNDFARTFRLPSQPEKALDTILSPTAYSRINIGTLSYQNKKKHFAVSTGIGFDAAVCHQAVISKLKVLLNKIKLGKLTYAGIALNRLFYLSPGNMSVVLDDRQKLSFEHVFFAAVLNHPYEGGGFKFCPDADPCDDVLNIIVVSGISKLKALFLLPTAFKGLHVHFKGVHTYTCKKAEIESSKALPVHTDGEPIFLKRDMTVSLEPEKLRVITG